jgi:hypothetical protein
MSRPAQPLAGQFPVLIRDQVIVKPLVSLTAEGTAAHSPGHSRNQAWRLHPLFCGRRRNCTEVWVLNESDGQPYRAAIISVRE